jgi:RNA polymerase sigma-70 factor, ECF subfamily
VKERLGSPGLLVEERLGSPGLLVEERLGSPSADPGTSPESTSPPTERAARPLRARRNRLVRGAVPGGGELTDLVASARRGDRAAFDEVVRRTYAETYTLAYRLTGNEEDARDVVQDAYLRAYRSLRRFRGEARFTTWLYRITANCASTLLAKKARQRHDVLADDEPLVDARPEHDPEARMAAGEDRAVVAGALAELPWRLRQVVVLRDIYDLPHAAIAAELGITEAAAKVRLHRARRRLRERLDAPGQAADPGSEDLDAQAS